MTDLIDRADSGEIPRPIGEERIVIRRTDLGEATQNLGEYLKTSPSFDAIPRRTIEIDDTVVYHLPPTVAVMPDPETEHLTLLGTIAGVDGELRPAAPGPRPSGPLPPPPPSPAPKLRRSVPYAIPADAQPWTRARHAKPVPRWVRWLTIAGVIVVAGVYVGLVVAAWAVIPWVL